MPWELLHARLPPQKRDLSIFMSSACARQDINWVNFLSNVDTNLTIDKFVKCRGREGRHRTVDKAVIAQHKKWVRCTVWIKCWGHISTPTSVSNGTIDSTIGFWKLLLSMVLFFTRRLTPLKSNSKKV